MYVRLRCATLVQRAVRREQPAALCVSLSEWSDDVRCDVRSCAGQRVTIHNAHSAVFDGLLPTPAPTAVPSVPSAQPSRAPSAQALAVTPANTGGLGVGVARVPAANGTYRDVAHAATMTYMPLIGETYSDESTWQRQYVSYTATAMPLTYGNRNCCRALPLGLERPRDTASVTAKGEARRRGRMVVPPGSKREREGA